MSASSSGGIGTECAAQLAALLEHYKARRILLVTGKRSFELSGAARALASVVEHRVLVHFDDFSPNPTLEEVERGVAVFRNEKPDIVVAIGGGSAIDLAKMVNGVAAHNVSARDLLTGQVTLSQPGLPLVAIPTTSGSGAETTHFAAVYVDGEKYSVTHDSLRPTRSILDATLTHSLSPYLTAATGMDALSQAIEAFWSVRSTESSRAQSVQAIKLCNRALVEATTHPTATSRDAMMQGAHLAGKAIDIARTTAPHALSYALTTQFGVTHGHAVALTLGAVLAHNASAGPSDTWDPRGAEHVGRTMDELYQLLGCPDGDAAQRHLHELMHRCGLHTRLRDVGVTRDALPGLVHSVNPQRLKNNPRQLSAESLGAILEAVF